MLPQPLRYRYEEVVSSTLVLLRQRAGLDQEIALFRNRNKELL